MELKEVLLKRRSVRKFKEDKIEEEKIAKLLHAAMSGPSACNRQPWDFHVVTNKDILKELRKASRFSNIDAPLAIIVAGNLSKALPLNLKEFWVQDTSAATENILLAATDLGLGAVWCGMYPQVNPYKRVQRILNLSDKIIPLNIIYIGYPLSETEPKDYYDEKHVHYYK